MSHLSNPLFMCFVYEITFSIQNCWKVHLNLPYIFLSLAFVFFFLRAAKTLSTAFCLLNKILFSSKMQFVYAVTFKVYVSWSVSKAIIAVSSRNIYFQIMQFILLLLSIVSLNTNTHLPLLTTLLYPSGKQFFLLLTKPQLPTAFISLLLQNFLPHSVALRGRHTVTNPNCMVDVVAHLILHFLQNESTHHEQNNFFLPQHFWVYLAFLWSLTYLVSHNEWKLALHFLR